MTEDKIFPLEKILTEKESEYLKHDQLSQERHYYKPVGICVEGKLEDLHAIGRCIGHGSIIEHFAKNVPEKVELVFKYKVKLSQNYYVATGIGIMPDY